MRKIIEASLVLVLATTFTLVILAVIFPRHLRGGEQPALENTRTWPAVFVYGTDDRPGTGGGSTDPRFVDQEGRTACPYLAALAAASKCPATPRRDVGFGCPYLETLHRQLTDPESAPAVVRSPTTPKIHT